MTKTNAMRILEAAGVAFDTAEYVFSEDDLSGEHAANALGANPETVFKTIVTVGEKRGCLVFCVPADCEFDLKKCALAAGDKRVELLPLSKLFALTGYMRGGCSPVGMKKHFPTFIDETAVLFDHIYVSAGQRGSQLYLNPEELASFLNAPFCELT